MAAFRFSCSISGIKMPFSYSSLRLIASTHTQSYLNLLQSDAPPANLERDLDQIEAMLDSSCIEAILRVPTIPRLHVLRFFVWAGQKSHHRHSALLYNRACKHCDILRSPNALIDLLDAYKRDNLRVSVRTFKVVLNICREAKLPELSLQILRRMKEFNCRPDTVTYNVVIRLFCEKTGMDVAAGLMEEMAVMGLYPDLITYVSVIKGLCEVGRFDEARRLFDEMRMRGCSPNKVVYSALIDGACRAGNLDVAMEFLGAMENLDFGCAPNAVTYTSLIQNLCEKDRAMEAVGVLDHMGSHGCAPNWVAVSTLINGLITTGHVDEAYKVADRVAGEETLSSDKCYSCLAVALLRAKKVEEAEKVVKKMVAIGAAPSGLAVTYLIKELCSSRLCLDALSWCRELVKGECLLTVDSDLHSFLLAALCREGHFVEAEDLIDEMVEKSIQGREPYVCDVVKQLKEAGKENLNLKLTKINGS